MENAFDVWIIGTDPAGSSAAALGRRAEIFSAAQANSGVIKKVRSVWADYVWDTANPCVPQPERVLRLFPRIVSTPMRWAVNAASSLRIPRRLAVG